MIDLGTGNNNKINWPLEDKQEMIDIIETVYRGARKGRGLVVSPKDYSTKYRYWGHSTVMDSSQKNLHLYISTVIVFKLLYLLIVIVWIWVRQSHLLW